MEKTEKQYKQLSAEERATIMLMSRDAKGVREIGRFLNRSPGTISREMDRNSGEGVEYDASLAGEQASLLRIKPRKGLKLVVDGALLGVVVDHLKKKWSPEQIAGKFKVMHPDQPSERVSHETIYHTLYAMPRGELRRELIACLLLASRQTPLQDPNTGWARTHRTDAEHSFAPTRGHGSLDPWTLGGRHDQGCDESFLGGYAG